ncbi:MAG: hypothetical protein K0S74_938 [Chlamydiales bacterium]|nr:hypothetical protein [Chlamydiales bacterium]
MLSCIGWMWYKTGQYTTDKKVAVIIARNNGGQLGNQLRNFAHLYAYCLEKEYDLYNPTFRPDYAYYFKNFRNNALMHAQQRSEDSPAYARIWQWIQERYARKFFYKQPFMTNIVADNDAIIPIPPQNSGAWESPANQKRVYYVNKKKMDPSQPLFMENLLPGRYCFHSWAFQTDLGLHKYHKQLVELFRPHEEYQKNIDIFWERINPRRMVIGVHIRQGDYRDFADGRHFFEASTYRDRMLQLQERYHTYDPVFIVYSNEPRSIEEFRGLDCLIADGNLVEDLYSMAKCDLILGPASTYNDWAAWYGSSPKIGMEDFEAEFRNDLDKVVVSKIDSRLSYMKP